MSLLQTWYGLSDYEVEDRINDSLSFSYFLGMNLDEVSPNHSTLSRFRSAMTEKGAYEKLLKEFNRQLEYHNIIVKNRSDSRCKCYRNAIKTKRKSNL